jgi:hypothetical protein
MITTAQCRAAREAALRKRVAVWRLTARYYAEMPGDHVAPTREEWADLTETLSQISEMLS